MECVFKWNKKRENLVKYTGFQKLKKKRQRSQLLKILQIHFSRTELQYTINSKV